MKVGWSLIYNVPLAIVTQNQINNLAATFSNSQRYKFHFIFKFGQIAFVILCDAKSARTFEGLNNIVDIVVGVSHSN